MRVCAVAAAALLAIDPANLMSVSFQMSFGAVVALIAVYETFSARSAYLLHRPRCRLRFWGIAERCWSPRSWRRSAPTHLRFITSIGG